MNSSVRRNTDHGTASYSSNSGCIWAEILSVQR